MTWFRIAPLTFCYNNFNRSLIRKDNDLEITVALAEWRRLRSVLLHRRQQSRSFRTSYSSKTSCSTSRHFSSSPKNPGRTVFHRKMYHPPAAEIPQERQPSALNLCRKESGLDRTDAYVAAQMPVRGTDAVYSSDRDFDRVDGITRLEP